MKGLKIKLYAYNLCENENLRLNCMMLLTYTDLTFAVLINPVYIHDTPSTIPAIRKSIHSQHQRVRKRTKISSINYFSRKMSEGYPEKKVKKENRIFIVCPND